MSSLRLFPRRLLHAWDERAPSASFVQILCNAFARKALEADANGSASIHPFDLAYQVETGGFRPGESLFPGLYHTAYYAVAPSALAQALDQLGLTGLDWTRFTFVDLGCGKGRALLVASRHPFERLAGVELSFELCDVARRNVAAFDAPWQVCRSFDIRHADATVYPFPEAPLVVFLYHPFLAPALRRMLRNLERSARQRPREIYLLYANPTYSRTLARFPFLEPQWHYRLPLSPEDAAADRHGITHEHFALYCVRPPV